jgi:hypothetical protein
MSYLEQAKPWVTEADNLRDRALFLDISNAIARDLDETVARVGAELGRRTPDWLTWLIRRWHEQRCTIVTLNYDTLIETAAAAVEFSGRDRLQPGDLYPAILTDAALRSGSAPRERPSTESFRLLKLHGSTNWYYSGRAAAFGEPIYFVPPLSSGAAGAEERARHELRRRAVADKYPFMVPPVYDKSPLLTHETIRALWFEAGTAFKRARRIVCIGYSLPPSDLTMKHFLRATCRPETRIDVVAESLQATENIARLFRTTGLQVESFASGENCIAEFVERLQAA